MKRKYSNKYNHIQLGKIGEEKAISFLDKIGYEILERNYRTHFGEIDIIAVKDRCLVLIEVKTRSSVFYGSPCMAVDNKKISHIKLSGWNYLKQHNFEWQGIRIDIVEILEIENKSYIRHLKGVA